MLTLKKANYNVQAYSETVLKTYFDSLNCPIITTSISSHALYVTVNNIVSLIFNFGIGRTQVSYNGSTTSYSVLNTYNPATITTVTGDSIVYVQFNGVYGAGRRILFLYEMIDNKSYFGAIGSGTESTHAWFSIADLTLRQVENNLTYTHKKMLDYTTTLNYIDYSTDLLFENGDAVSDIADMNTVTCTTVTSDSVITFGGKNYYSAGTNTLIQLNVN